MSDGATGPLEFLLFIIIGALVGGFAFIGTLGAWRRWSDNRRMRKLWSRRAKEAKQHREKRRAKANLVGGHYSSPRDPRSANASSP
jgi:hypothetical protein